jgi:hypothetical protein
MRLAKSFQLLMFIIISLSLKAYEDEFRMGSIFEKRINDSNCKTKDLRGPKLGPVRNQDTVGWCFGYTAADLISYKINQRVSAVDLSITYYNKMEAMPRDAILSKTGGGQPVRTFDTTIKDGFCMEKDFPSEDYLFPKEYGYIGNEGLSDILKLIEEEHNSPDQLLKACRLKSINSLFKNLTIDDFKKVFSRKELSAFQMILELQKINCKNRFVPKNKFNMVSGLKGKREVLKEIDDQLEKDNPISYNFNANFLLPLKDQPGFDNHYASIVGRKFNEETKTCQYLIRNSWGRNCTQYPPPYNKQCDEGNIWVNEDIIHKNLIGINYIVD